jgi:hypothetical protein
MISVAVVSIALAIIVPILRQSRGITSEEFDVIHQVNKSSCVRLAAHEYGKLEGTAFVLSIDVNCPNPDAELRKFSPLLNKLRRVDIYAAGTQLTNKGIAELHSVQSLCELLVKDTQVSDEAIRDLHQHVPGCKLVHTTRSWYPTNP